MIRITGIRIPGTDEEPRLYQDEEIDLILNQLIKNIISTPNFLDTNFGGSVTGYSVIRHQALLQIYFSKFSSDLAPVYERCFKVLNLFYICKIWNRANPKQKIDVHEFFNHLKSTYPDREGNRYLSILYDIILGSERNQNPDEVTYIKHLIQVDEINKDIYDILVEFQRHFKTGRNIPDRKVLEEILDRKKSETRLDTSDNAGKRGEEPSGPTSGPNKEVSKSASNIEGPEGGPSVPIGYVEPPKTGFFFQYTAHIKNNPTGSTPEYDDEDLNWEQVNASVVNKPTVKVSKLNIAKNEWHTLPIPQGYEFEGFVGQVPDGILSKCGHFYRIKLSSSARVTDIIYSVKETKDITPPPNQTLINKWVNLYKKSQTYKLTNKTLQSIEELKKENLDLINLCRRIKNTLLKDKKYVKGANHGSISEFDSNNELICSQANMLFQVILAHFDYYSVSGLGIAVNKVNKGKSEMHGSDYHALTKIWDHKNNKWVIFDATPSGDPNITESEPRDASEQPNNGGETGEDILNDLIKRLLQYELETDPNRTDREILKDLGYSEEQIQELIKAINILNEFSINGKPFRELLHSIIELINNNLAQLYRKSSTQIPENLRAVNSLVLSGEDVYFRGIQKINLTIQGVFNLILTLDTSGSMAAKPSISFREKNGINIDTCIKSEAIIYYLITSSFIEYLSKYTEKNTVKLNTFVLETGRETSENFLNRREILRNFASMYFSNSGGGNDERTLFSKVSEIIQNLDDGSMPIPTLVYGITDGYPDTNAVDIIEKIRGLKDVSLQMLCIGQGDGMDSVNPIKGTYIEDILQQFIQRTFSFIIDFIENSLNEGDLSPRDRMVVFAKIESIRQQLEELFRS